MRQSWKNLGSVSFNIIGLGVALSLCIFVYMLYAYNLEFDSTYTKNSNTYRVHSVTLHNEKEKRNEFSPIALDDILRNKISGISQVSSYFTQNITVKRGIDFFQESTAIVSTDFVEMFEIPLWNGSFEEFDNQPLVYLTQPVAFKYFGDLDPIGENLTLYLKDTIKLQVTVGGVFDRIPANSSFRFQILINQNDYLRSMHHKSNNWSSNVLMGHYLNIPHNQTDQISEEINQYIAIQNEYQKSLKIKRFELIPFAIPMPSDMIIGKTYTNSRTRPEALIIFTTLASLIFLIACFNMANNAMALISKRLREIGVRRTLGAGKFQILVQFLIEMGIIAAFAFVIAISMANYISSAILGLFGTNFLLQDIDLSGVILFVIGFLMITIVLSGLLPALYAWKFQPVEIMRKSVKLKGVSWISKCLIGAQFSFSIIVLTLGITFSQNVDYLNELDLGYQEHGIINLPIDNQYFNIVERKINQIPGVSTAGASNHIGNFGRYSERVSVQIDTTLHEVRHYGVGPNYLDHMKVRMVSGRSFLQGEAFEANTIIVNKAFAQQFFKNENPINAVIKINGERKTIIGVAVDVIDDVVKAAELLPTTFALCSEKEYRHLIVS